MKKQSITSNYIYNFIYQLIITLIPLLTTPYLTRILGAENLGIYSYTYSIVTIFYLISALGINTYGQREIAYVQDDEEKRSKLFFELVIIRIFATLLSLVLLFIVILLESKYKIYYQIFSIYIIANLFDITWLYQGIENFKGITFRNIIVKFLYLISIFVFVKSKSDLSIYILLFSAMTLLVNLSLWINLKKFISKPKNLEVRKHIKAVLSFFIPQVASLIYTVLDKTMLGIMGSDIKEVSFYEQATYLVKTVLLFITIINSIMVSKISYAFNQDNKQLIVKYLNTVINFIWVLGIPMMFGMCAVIRNFVPWFYGDEYISVINLVYLMSPMIIIIGLNNLIGIQFLVSTKKQNIYIFAIVTGSVVNFILNLILIRNNGMYGATIASVISEGIILLIEVYYFKKLVPSVKIISNYFKYILFGIIMFLITYFSGNIFLSAIYKLMFQVLVGISTYLCLLIISRDQFCLSIIKNIKK